MHSPDDEASPGSDAPLPPEHSLPSYGEPTPETHRAMSREDDADLALRATTFGPYARVAMIVLFLVTIALALVWEPLFGRSLRPTLRALRGLSTHLPKPAELKATERTIEQDSSLSQWLLPRVQLPLTGWLGAGNEQAYSGREGWLFYRPDVEYITGRPFLEAGDDSVKAIVDFHDQLKARGIDLIVVPAPVKASLEGHWLARSGSTRRVLQNPSFAEWQRRLRDAGVQIFDPLTALQARLDRPEPLHLKTDTHWRPETMELIANTLAGEVKLPPMNAPITRDPDQYVTNLGDIAIMLKLPVTQSLYAPEKVIIHPVRSGNQDWRPTRRADVLLLGDSFSNIYSLEGLGWGEAAGFAEQLSGDLKRPLDCILRNSDGAFATRAILSRELASGSDRLAGKKLVIWEFAARELAFGQWKRLPLTLGQARESRFYTPPAGRLTLVSGTVQAISPVPRPGSVPYADHLVTLHLVDLAGPDLPPGQPLQALVSTWSMRQNTWTHAARLRPGDRITLRLRLWSEVSAQYEKFNRSELDDPALQLEEPSWGEPVE